MQPYLIVSECRFRGCRSQTATNRAISKDVETLIRTIVATHTVYFACCTEGYKAVFCPAVVCFGARSQTESCSFLQR